MDAMRTEAEKVEERKKAFLEKWAKADAAQASQHPPHTSPSAPSVSDV
jgi:hypothetical protein